MTLSEAATNRFSESYLAARSLARVGKVISRISILLTTPTLIVGLSRADGFRLVDITVFAFFGLVALLGYAMGKALTAQAHILRASVDQAVSASAVLSEADRVELFTAAPSQSWRPLGLGTTTSESQEVSSQPPRSDEGVLIHSPIASLIASGRTSQPPVFFSPVERTERHRARSWRPRPR